ncbi:MAG: hypothetical protein AAGJ32_01505 [Pseudomonadota bacterium]
MIPLIISPSPLPTDAYSMPGETERVTAGHPWSDAEARRPAGRAQKHPSLHAYEPLDRPWYAHPLLVAATVTLICAAFWTALGSMFLTIF